MIEKLKEHDVVDPKTDKVIGKIGCDLREIMDKLNELVDAVNELQEMCKSCDKQIGILAEQIARLQTRAKNVQDPYAEQRKWIGCVCKFWFDNPNHTALDYLEEIKTGKNGIEYYSREIGDWFPHCEPVKPDDDIIYKKEQQ